jgi:hypothetical protein
LLDLQTHDAIPGERSKGMESINEAYVCGSPIRPVAVGDDSLSRHGRACPGHPGDMKHRASPGGITGTRPVMTGGNHGASERRALPDRR